MTDKFPNNKINIPRLNNRARSATKELIESAERNYNMQLLEVETCIANNNKAKILLLAGPSASSKTTTSHKLMERLCKRGIHSVVISLDDFYIDRDKLPILPDGSIDYETIETLDLGRLSKCFKELLQNHKSEFPVFDFSSGKRSEKTRLVEISKDSLVIIEGLHALNPRITEGLARDSFFKLYISPNSDYCVEKEIILSARDIRLVRRIIRDNFHRGSGLLNTLDMWVNVVSAEVHCIIPFRDEADFVIDSTVIYEPCVYVKYIRRLIDEAVVDAAFKDRVESISNAMGYFAEIDINLVPEDTVLREFLD